MSGAIRDLFVAVTTKVDASGLQTLDARMSGIADKFKKVASFFAGGFIAKGVSDFIKGQIEAGDHLAKTSVQLGIASEDLERFGFIADASGTPVESMYGALNKLNKSIGDSSPAFAKLGVALKNADGTARGTSDVFADVADKFGGIESQGEKTKIAMDLFGKSGAQLIPLLSAGSGELEKLGDRFEELGGATPAAFLKQAEEINDLMADFGFTSNKLKSQLVQAFAPGLIALFKGLTKASAAVVGFEKRTKALSTAAKAFILFFAVGKLAKIGGSLVKAAKAAKLFQSALGFGKSIITAGGLFLAYVIIDDLIRLAQGKKSAIGEFMTSLVGPEKAQEFAQQLRDLWASLSEKFAEILPQIMAFATNALPGVINGFLQMADVVSRVIKLVATFVESLVNLPGMASNAFRDLKEVLGFDVEPRTAAQAAAGDKQRDLDRRFGEVFDGGNFGGIGGTKAMKFEATPSVVAASNVAPSLAASGWAAAAAAPKPAGKVEQTNNTTINVNAPDAKAAGAEVARILPDANKKMLRDAGGALKKGAL